MSVEGLDDVLRKMDQISDKVNDALQDGLMASATMVQSEAVKSIARGVKSGRTYTRGRITHQASAPGEAPATDTGALIRGFQIEDAFINRNVVFVLNNSDHAEPLEFGTSRIAARPFLFPALEGSRKKIMKEIRSQVERSLK